MENENKNIEENTIETTGTIEEKPKKKVFFIGIIIGVILLICAGLGVHYAIDSGYIKGKNNKEISKENEEKTNEKDAEEGDEIVKEDESENNEDDKQEESSDTQTSDGTNVDVQPTESVVEKVTMYAKSNVNVRSGAGTSNSKIGSLTKGQEIVKIGEENGWSKIEFNGSTGYVKSEYLSTEKVEVSIPNNQSGGQTSGNTTTNNGGTNNNTSSNQSQGSNNGGSTTSGMYSKMDSASKDRMDKCANIFKTGLGSQYIPVVHENNYTSYWGETIKITRNDFYGSWMYMIIKGWSNMGIGYETEPVYAEVPLLAKQCFEAIAPEGGTELYNRVNSLILQYGHPLDVPTQGTISESIPGLSVTLTQGKNGLEVCFWAE